MHIDNIMLFAKNEKGITNSDTNNKNIQPGYRNGILLEKCAMLTMKSGKREIMEGIEVSNQEWIRILGEGVSYKYLGILEVDTIKHSTIREKIIKSTLEKTSQNPALQQKSFQKNKHLGSSSYKIARILLKIKEELRHMDQRTRKLMTIHKALHPRDDIDYVSRKGGGRGLTSTEYCTDASILRDDTKRAKKG